MIKFVEVNSPEYRHGKAEGIVEGKAEGASEKQKEIALNLLKDNVSEWIILSSTGLSKQQLDDIKAENKLK